jgi:teichuronic acid biosynthesis glycosyltransferase TuaG
MPRVSVIIPAFNAEEHVEETLRSVQGQTYDDWEIVVCDDCSTDTTAERVRGFGGNVRLARTETNSGPAVARNLAIAHSSGELLALLDADDYWLPSYLERQVSLYDSAQTRHGDVGVVVCDASLLRGDGFRRRTHMDVVRFPREVTLLRLLQANPIFGSVLMPRRVVDEVGGFSPDLSRSQDFDLWLRIVEAGYRIVANREVLAVHRIRKDSWSSDVGATARYSQETYRRALERGNLSADEQRMARREIRRKRLMERIASGPGLSYGQTVRQLPLLLVVLAEHPHTVRSLPRLVFRGRKALTPLA